jgi:P4 family phage/plasmid primase-like protien
MTKFISGFGQYHSNEPNAKNKLEYATITMEEIQSMVDDPKSTPKINSQWFIPSTLMSRNFLNQLNDGQFGCLWMDFDEDPKPLNQLFQLWNKQFGFDCEMYLTSSATTLQPKSRLIVPLLKMINGSQWILYQEILMDVFTKHGIKTDPSAKRTGQLCYLPNKGLFYQSHSIRNGNLMDVETVFAEQYGHKVAQQAQIELETRERINATKLKRDATRAANGFTGANLIETFNEHYSIEELLLNYGYQQRGNSFRHPKSESGSFSASIKNGRVNTLSTNDPLWNGNKGAHDAFSVFVALNHCGDYKKALKDAGDNYLKTGSVSFNKATQIEYAKQNLVAKFDEYEPLGGDVVPSSTELMLVKNATESGVALAFVHKFNGKLLYCNEMASWLVWDGNYWKPDTTLLAYNYCVNEARKIPSETKSLQKAAFAKGVETIAKSEREFAKQSDEFNTHLHLIATPDGTFDLRTGIRHNPNPNDLITNICGVAPKHGTPTQWLEFLKFVTDGNDEMIDFLQQWIGYCLTGFTGAEKFIYMDGNGGNGKGVIAHAMQIIMGDYFHTAPNSLLIHSNQIQHPTSLASLKWKRMIVASELPVGARLDEQRLKGLTGGDRITARKMRENETTFMPEGKITIASNHAPRIVRPDDAIKRRLIVFPMPNKVQKPDPLFKKIVIPNETPQIFNWALEGASKILANNEIFNIPQICIDASEIYLGSQDAIGTFLNEMCEMGGRKKTKASYLFKKYEEWCNHNGENYIMASRDFYDEIRRRGFVMRTYEGTSHFWGLELFPIVGGDFDEKA